MIKPNTINSFLLVYFYILETTLNKSKNNLASIKFQSEEANTDEYLKKYFQKHIKENNSINNNEIEYLSLKIDSIEVKINLIDLLDIKITNVFRPDELSKKLKIKIAQTKKSVYTSPDLYLEINDGKNIYYESLELKSTKTNNIPGSSVQQVSPFEWVIFVKRNKKEATISTGFYINSITEKLPFPDRSPRPQIGFKTLNNWNNKHRKLKGKTLFIENISASNNEKLKLLNDWQDYLASEWLAIIKAKNTKNNEKWFNNAIWKFAVKFLEYSDSLTEIQKKKLKNDLNSLIK